MTRHIHLTKKADLVIAPPSKSYAQRVLFAIALAKQSAIINNLGTNDDVLHILDIVKQLGFKVESAGDKTLIQKDSQPINSNINIGESGLGTRLSVPILSHFFDEYSVDGIGTILNRSMKWFADYLPQTGLNISLTNNHLPLKAKGTIIAGDYVVDGSESSQYISGLLMTLPLCSGNSTLTVTNPTSIPYIDITLKVMADFDVQVDHETYIQYNIPGDQLYFLDDLQYSVEGDYSGAAFWVVYGLLNGGISISNLNQHSVQADAAILEIVKMIGGKFTWENGILKVQPPVKLLPFNFDATHCPDLFPALVVLAAGIIGKSTIAGLNRLIHKESDRKAVILEEFSNLGLEMKIESNTLQIFGTGKLSSNSVRSHNDHRIAMSFAIASVLTDNGIEISDPNCVNKSYPNFWETTKQM